MKLLETRDLTKRFPVRGGIFRRVIDTDTAVRGASISLREREILGLVGESGSGKTTLARMLVRLTDPSEGRLYLQGDRVDELSQRDFRSYRRDIQIVFQDPNDSLDPRYTVKETIREGARFLTDWSGQKINEEIHRTIREVNLGPELLEKYPHQLSGGQRQRVGVARALVVRPRIIVCDEPTSALDVSIQAQIINLLLDLRDDYDLSYVFISHDLSLVHFISDRIAVMKDGEIVETGSAEQIYRSPRNAYTKELLEAASVHRVAHSRASRSS